jgi:hypothetical protein
MNVYSTYNGPTVNRTGCELTGTKSARRCSEAPMSLLGYHDSFFFSV